MTLREYIWCLFDDLPYGIFILLLTIFFGGALLSFSIYGIKKGSRYSMMLLLAEYAFLLFGSTVMFRNNNSEIGHSIVPFWSYMEIYHGNGQELLPQNIMNMVVFVPIGIMLGMIFRTMTWWKAAMIACSLSLSIELSQYALKRGFSEFDDIFHNVIGCMIGYAFTAMIRKRFIYKH